MSKLTTALLLPVLFLAACGSEKSGNVSIPSNAKAGWNADTAVELFNCKHEKATQAQLDAYCKCMAENITPKYTPDEVRQAKKDAEASNSTATVIDLLSINSQCQPSRLKPGKTTGGSSLPPAKPSTSSGGLPFSGDLPLGAGEAGPPSSSFPSLPSGFGGDGPAKFVPGADPRGFGEGDPLPLPGSSSSTSVDLQYSFDFGYCKTGDKRYLSLAALCDGVQSEKENGGCAKKERMGVFTSHGCPGTFTEKP